MNTTDYELFTVLFKSFMIISANVVQLVFETSTPCKITRGIPSSEYGNL